MRLRFSSDLSSMGGFPGGSDGKVSACNTGDLGSIPGLGRSSGKGNGNPLWYSCLENSMDGRAWWATVQGVTKSQTRLNDFTSLSSLGAFNTTHRSSHKYLISAYCVMNPFLMMRDSENPCPFWCLYSGWGRGYYGVNITFI